MGIYWGPSNIPHATIENRLADMQETLNALARVVPAEDDQRALRAAWLAADQVERAALSLTEAISKRLGEMVEI